MDLFFSGGLRGLLITWLLLDVTKAATSYDGRTVKESYDYIVIGGGTSGLVVANRLSEDPKKSLLVLEHGYINDSPNTMIPRAVAKFPNLGIDFWNVTSAPLEKLQNLRTTVQMADVVGANFQDHPQMMASWNLTSGLAVPNPGTLASNATYNASAWAEYEGNRTGPYTVAWSNTAAFLPLRNFTSAAAYAAIMDAVADPGSSKRRQEDEELIALAGYRAQRAILRRHLGSPDAAAIEYPLTAGGLGTSGLNKPLSRGTITLAPSSTNSNINNTLGNISPADRAVVLAAVRWIRDLYATSPLLARYGPVELAPGLAAQTDEAMWTALVSAGLVRPSNAHPSGTCAMMPTALGGCVGADLRVHGIRRLAVVDASVMPLIPGTHSQTTVYAVAEKAADLIKARAR
ncbi:choline dehydrogenase [Apiospora phragmitis]|uniref:Choline dehydrogenase n=1 Tax=Apiospora phragmitis TaxID=2905665 RepID=A0ABR1X5E8_9PEZI